MKSEVESIARQIAREQSVHFLHVEQHAEPNSWKVTFSNPEGNLLIADFLATDSSSRAIRRNLLQLAFGIVE